MLKGKIAVVTGGTRGIGYAIVKKYLENGAKVILFGSRQETVDKALGILKGRKSGMGSIRCLPESDRRKRSGRRNPGNSQEIRKD